MNLAQHYEPRDLFFESPMSSDFTTDSVEVTHHRSGAIQLNYSGFSGTKGIARIQGSLDNVNWSNLDHPGDVCEIVDASGVIMWEILSINYKYIRLKYVATAVTAGDADIYFFLRYGT